jgi:phospholipid-binding lipoprotein MlaA
MNWRIASRFAGLLSVAALAGACAAQPNDVAWDSGGALSQELPLSARIQFAQTSDDNDDDTDDLYPDYEEDYDENDPLEIPNRFIFAFNQTLDVFIVKPAASTYRFLLPLVIRDSIANFLRNLATPVVLINDLLQGEFERAEVTMARFAINSSGGVLGLFDVAADEGYEYHEEDFGQTLASYGIGEGAYLVLPLFGPSSIRDGIGRLGDIFFDPLTYVGQAYDVQTEFLLFPLVKGIDTRSRNIETLEDLERDSIDFYARIRSLWRQNRQSEIDNGRNTGPTVTPGLSDFDFDTEPKDGQVGNSQ